MASYNELLALIDAYINQNGVQAITGQVLNGVLRAMVDQLGRGYTIMGTAVPSTDPGTPDGPESWFASTPGTYTDMGGLTVANAELALLSYTPSDGWAKTTLTQGIVSTSASVDDTVGTPSVTSSYVNGVLTFEFHNLKGNTGDPAGFGAVTASVDDQIGTPSVQVQTSGPDTAKAMSFQFHNLKGETGVTSVVATVDNTTGTPTCSVSLVGQELHLDFTGLKGVQGDTGVSADYPITIANNLTTNDPTAALSAAMGVQLESEVSQLELEVHNLSGKFYGVFEIVSELPEGDSVGYAFVGDAEPFYLFVFDGNEWINTETLITGIVGPRGEQGIQGETGIQGLQGPPGVSSVVVTVDNETGVPFATATLNNGVLTIALHNIKGEQGNTGSSVDYPFTIVDNLDTEDATQALSASQGKRLKEQINNYEIESEINLLTLPAKNGFMANDTQWLIPVTGNPRTHISIPVNEGDWYQIETQETQVGIVGFLTRDQIPTANLETIDSVGGLGLAKNTTVNFQIPVGCTYLAVNKTRQITNDWLPKKLYKTAPPVTLKGSIDELKNSVHHLDYPPFFSQVADWDVIKTDEVRSTLVDLALVRGELPSGSYIKYMGGRSSNPGQFAFYVYDSNGNTLSNVMSVIPTDGTLSTLYSKGKCSFRLVVDGSKMKMGENTFFDWASSDLLLDNNYLRVEGTPKTIVCFGDSITQFSDSLGLSYPQYLSRLSGCKVYNAGIGGTRLARRATPTAPVTTEEMAWASVDISNLIGAWINNDWTVVDSAITYLYNHGHDYRDIVAGLKLIDPSAVDIVTIFGGTNDFTGNSPLGTIGSTDISNVSGALETMINLIQTENQAIEVFVFAPIVRYINNTRTDAYWSDNYESNGKKLPDVAEHIENTCKYFHINCENWYWTLGWNQFNFSEYFNDNDGTHPYKGFKYIGEKMFKYLYGKTNFTK